LLYSDQNKSDSALLMYQRAVAANPSYSKARYNLALGFLNGDKLDSAIVHFKAVTELDPENLKALYNLGVCYSRRELLDDAALTYYQLLNNDPTNTKAINNLGTVLLRQEKYDSADVYFSRLVGLTKSPEAYFNRAKARQELDSVDAAMQDYRKAIELRPDYAKAYHNLAILEDKAGNQRVAIELLKKSVAMDTDNWKSYWKLGQIYAAMNDMPNARDAYTMAAKSNPDSEKFRREYQTIMPAH
jgi:tetratricopeptide (TPR) repeat protein